MDCFDALLILASVIAGGIAAVTGFGIGSILTPLLALQVGTKLAVAVIAIPHFVATAIRFWVIRAHVSRKALIGFGIASAVGGLGGALLHASFQSTALTLIFGGLLLFAGFTGMTGLAQKMRLQGPTAWVAGALSGGFGGLVGNQGGIRSAALMTYDLPKEALIATSTAIGLVVDLARLPVYIASEHGELVAARGWILGGTVGVTLGTLLGIRFLRGISEAAFRRILGALIFLLGVYMILKGIGLAA
jgi:uncharacterized membrane protein YfcA